MARFPKKEADIVALAERLWQGLLSNRPTIYPNPPVHPISLRFKAITYRRQREDLIAKQAAVEAATATKDEALEELVEAGGKPRAYKVQRRSADSGSWQDVATAIVTEVTLVEQPQKQELEYRVIAVNKAGEGSPSNTAMVVL